MHKLSNSGISESDVYTVLDPFVLLSELTYTFMVMELVTVIAFAIVSLAILFP